MHKITVSTTVAHCFIVLSAAGLVEVSHWGELWHDRTSCVETPVECGECTSTALFVIEHNVDVANHVVTHIVDHMHLLDETELAELAMHILVELLEVLLQQALVDVEHLGALGLGVLVHVG